MSTDAIMDYAMGAGAVLIVMYVLVHYLPAQAPMFGLTPA